MDDIIENHGAVVRAQGNEEEENESKKPTDYDFDTSDSDPEFGALYEAVMARRAALPPMVADQEGTVHVAPTTLAAPAALAQSALGALTPPQSPVTLPDPESLGQPLTSEQRDVVPPFAGPIWSANHSFRCGDCHRSRGGACMECAATFCGICEGHWALCSTCRATLPSSEVDKRAGRASSSADPPWRPQNTRCSRCRGPVRPSAALFFHGCSGLFH